MSNYRLTIFFEEGGYGFTENWWTANSQILTIGPGTLSDKLVQARLAPLSVLANIVGIRVTTQGAFRSALNYAYFNTAQPNGLPGQAGATGVWPGLKYGFQIPTTGGKQIPVTREFGGLSIDPVTNAFRYTELGSTSRGKWVKFFNELNKQGNGWGWLGQTNRYTSTVATVAPNSNGTVTVTTTGNIWPTTPGGVVRIRISGIKGCFELNGPQLVTPTPSTLNSFTTVKRIAIFPYTAGGKVTYATNDLVPAGSPNLNAAVRICSRKPGRTFFSGRGRRKGQAAA